MTAKRNIAPFANESETISIGEFTVENREDRVSFYGNLDITRDKEGLRNAFMLKQLLEDILSVLQEEKLPDKIQLKSTKNISNPFQ